MSWARNNLKSILTFLAKYIVRKYHPIIIVITGTVGKTSTKEALYTILRHTKRVRASTGNHNNEFGVPLTIIGEYQKVGGVFFWMQVILRGIGLIMKRSPYPDVLILEYAADHPGDIRHLLKIAQPHISIVTAIGDIPVHVEFYSGPDAIAREKARVIEALPRNGYAILNADDQAVLHMQEKTQAQVISFGVSPSAEVRITQCKNTSEKLPEGGYRPRGMSCKLEQGGNVVPVRIENVFGQSQAYAIAAASAGALALGINLVRSAEALQYYESPVGRMRLLNGVKSTYILDDSYNASPLSMRNALETMRDLKAQRKIAVLGDMRELGRYGPQAHEAIGELVPEIFDRLVTVGNQAKFLAEAAIKKGMPHTHVMSFDTADQASIEVQGLLEKGDLVLVKGSHSVGLERIVEEIKYIKTRG